ncbi:MAG: hypothetical protein LBJ07_03330 [Actinomycetes bacterium]|jgi:hypothetical protein|nr:hypothetical protein [Actinomycetes bacterium]
MADQDFFFEDEEVVEEKPKAAKSGSGNAKGSKGGVSASRTGAPKKVGAPRKGSASAGSVYASEAFQFSTVVVILIAVIALLLGFLVGILVGRGLTPPVSAAPATNDSNATPMGSGMGSGTAPELDEEQMDGGTLPEGHPDISGSESGETSAPAEGQ